MFVIVALVIFGIFVVISYLLFRDKLQTGLAGIFTDSFTEVEKIYFSENILPNIDLTNNWKYNRKSDTGIIVGNPEIIIPEGEVDYAIHASGAIYSGIYFISDKYKVGDTVKISVVAKGTGVLNFGIEGQDNNKGKQTVGLTDKFTEYSFEYTVTVAGKAFIIYTASNTSEIWAYNPSLQIQEKFVK